MEPKTKIEAPKDSQELTITREFDLPVHLVYRAYSEAELVEQWMGTKVIKLEHKNHGSFQFETSNNGSVVFRCNGAIHQVKFNRRIIRTFEIENTPIGVQLEFLNFEELENDKSKLSIHIIYQSEKHRAEQLKLPFSYGLNMAHNRLQEIISSIK